VLQFAPQSGASTLTALTMNTGWSLDLTSGNPLVIQYGSKAMDPVSAILGELSSAYHGTDGLWSGTGITSSVAEANANLLTLGYVDGDTDVGGPAAMNQIRIVATLSGDANLDGTVGFSDMLAVAQHFGSTGNDWFHGNFTYAANGAVGFSDVLLVAQNFGHVSALGAESVGDSSSIVRAWDQAAAVPEPAVAGGMAISLLLTSARARRRGY
jgi:hypothetical protein